MLQSVSTLSVAVLFGQSADRAPVGTLFDELSCLDNFSKCVPAVPRYKRLPIPIFEAHFTHGLSAFVPQAGCERPSPVKRQQVTVRLEGGSCHFHLLLVEQDSRVSFLFHECRSREHAFDHPFIVADAQPLKDIHLLSRIIICERGGNASLPVVPAQLALWCVEIFENLWVYFASALSKSRGKTSIRPHYGTVYEFSKFGGVSSIYQLLSFFFPAIEANLLCFCSDRAELPINLDQVTSFLS